MKRGSQSSPEFTVVIDTSTLFSALYNPKGNEAELLELADRGHCEVKILDYVLEELRDVFQRRNIDFSLVSELLKTYGNITISEMEELDQEEIKVAKEVIDHPPDRPIFIFARRRIKEGGDVRFVSGDKGFFKKDVKRELEGRVMTTREAVNEIGDDKP